VGHGKDYNESRVAPGGRAQAEDDGVLLAREPMVRVEVLEVRGGQVHGGDHGPPAEGVGVRVHHCRRPAARLLLHPALERLPVHSESLRIPDAIEEHACVPRLVEAREVQRSIVLNRDFKEVAQAEELPNAPQENVPGELGLPSAWATHRIW